MQRYESYLHRDGRTLAIELTPMPISKRTALVARLDVVEGYVSSVYSKP